MKMAILAAHPPLPYAMRGGIPHLLMTGGLPGLGSKTWVATPAPPPPGIPALPELSHGAKLDKLPKKKAAAYKRAITCC